MRPPTVREAFGVTTPAVNRTSRTSSSRQRLLHLSCLGWGSSQIRAASASDLREPGWGRMRPLLPESSLEFYVFVNPLG